jgi:transcription elongation GreA/GreB family factor
MVSGLALGLTADGMQQLTSELAGFRERRATLADALATSPDDLGELQGELALVDRRITEIQSALARARPIDLFDRIPGVVGLGSRVTVRWEEDGDETYIIVDPAEVDSRAGRISFESPVGQALTDRRVGARLAVETLAGPAWLEVLAVD